MLVQIIGNQIGVLATSASCMCSTHPFSMSSENNYSRTFIRVECVLNIPGKGENKLVGLVDTIQLSQP